MCVVYYNEDLISADSKCLCCVVSMVIHWTSSIWW